jgi:hypothetical protein
VHHFYLSHEDIWTAQPNQHSSPLWKSILSVRDFLSLRCGSLRETIQLMTSWSTNTGLFLAHAYQFLRLMGATISWHRVVWEQWSLPKYSFILWLAALGKLRTRDLLSFIPIDPTYVFCRQEEESHKHLFFLCGWPGHLWSMITSWLRLNRATNSLSSALRELHPKKRSMVARMRRVS